LRPLPFVWPYALLYWSVCAWVFWPEFRLLRSAQRGRTDTDAKSLQVILVGLNLAYFAAYAIAWVPWLAIRSHRVTVFFLGIAVLVAGSLLRRHCWRILGESFTGDVRARADQEIVARGAYAFVRHPSYTAAILMNLGVALAVGSWAAIALMLLASFLVYGYRIAVEERALLSAIGEPYRRYMQSRKRLIPFVY
jgi:protein-S-isoprenylcysteine O-methyltransferase Ste14